MARLKNYFSGARSMLEHQGHCKKQYIQYFIRNHGVSQIFCIPLEKLKTEVEWFVKKEYGSYRRYMET